MFSLEDIDENMPGYGNHINTYTVRCRQLQITKLLCTSKQLDHFNSNFDFINNFEVMILQKKQKTKF